MRELGLHDEPHDAPPKQIGDHRSDFKAYSPLSSSSADDDRHRGAYRVLSFDYRGHGRSSATRPYTFSQIVDNIEGLRAHFTSTRNEGKVVICGGSFGGFLALHYAIRYADHVGHLVLRGTAASWHRDFFDMFSYCSCLFFPFSSIREGGMRNIV